MNDKSRQQNPELPVVDLRPKPCASCKADTEYWWSYCAMCGYHIASGARTPKESEMRNPGWCPMCGGIDKHRDWCVNALVGGVDRG